MCTDIIIKYYCCQCDDTLSWQCAHASFATVSQLSVSQIEAASGDAHVGADFKFGANFIIIFYLNFRVNCDINVKIVMTDTVQYIVRIVVTTLLYYTLICVFKEVRKYWSGIDSSEASKSHLDF